MSEPETIEELRRAIVSQLAESETVTITLTEGDGIHELIESIDHAIDRAETIKGLDRATVEYTRIITEHDKTIKAQIALIACYEKEVKDLNDRIAHLEEANASRGEARQITKEEWQENFK